MIHAPCCGGEQVAHSLDGALADLDRGADLRERSGKVGSEKRPDPGLPDATGHLANAC